MSDQALSLPLREKPARLDEEHLLFEARKRLVEGQDESLADVFARNGVPTSDVPLDLQEKYGIGKFFGQTNPEEELSKEVTPEFLAGVEANLAAKDAEIAELKAAIAEAEANPTPVAKEESPMSLINRLAAAEGVIKALQSENELLKAEASTGTVGAPQAQGGTSNSESIS